MGSADMDEWVLCMENRLDCELEGVNTGFVLKVTGEDRGREDW
jgi:hypothetical protein